MPIRPNGTSSQNYNILLTGVHHPRITLFLSQTAMVKIYTIPYYEFNATVYPAYIGLNYHECMFFVCETLCINVYIQTGNKNTEN